MFQIYVRTIDCGVFPLDVTSDCTIQNLKRFIQDIVGVVPESQRLAFKGKVLEEGRTLGDYAIVDGNTIFLIDRIKRIQYKSSWYWLCFEKETPTWVPYGNIHNRKINEYYQTMSQHPQSNIKPLCLSINNIIYEISVNYNGQGNAHVVPLGTEGTQINIDSDDPMIRPIIHDIPNKENTIRGWIVSNEKKSYLERFSTNIFDRNNQNQNDKIGNDEKKVLLEASPYIIGRQCNGHCGNSISYVRYCLDIIMHDINNNLKIPAFELYYKYREALFCPTDRNEYSVIFKAMSKVFWESIVLFYDCLSTHQKEHLINYITFFCLVYKFNYNRYDMFNMNLINIIKNSDIMEKSLHIINQCEDIKQINKTKKLIYQFQSNYNDIESKTEDEIEQKVKQYCIDFYKNKLYEYHHKIFKGAELLIIGSHTFTFNIDFPCFTSIQNQNNLDNEIKRNKFEHELPSDLYDIIDRLYNCEKHQRMKYPLNKEEIKVIYLYCRVGVLCSDIRTTHFREHQACKWYIFSKILYKALLKLMKSDDESFNTIKQQQYLYHGLSELSYDQISKNNSFKKLGGDDIIRMGTFASTAMDKDAADIFGQYKGFVMVISTKNFEKYYNYAKSINTSDDSVYLPYVFCFADISWISPYKYETEILLSPFYMKRISCEKGNVTGEIQFIIDILREKGNAFFNVSESKTIINNQ